MFRKGKALGELGYFEKAEVVLEDLKKLNPSGRSSLPSTLSYDGCTSVISRRFSKYRSRNKSPSGNRQGASKSKRTEIQKYVYLIFPTIESSLLEACC